MLEMLYDTTVAMTEERSSCPEAGLLSQRPNPRRSGKVRLRRLCPAAALDVDTRCTELSLKTEGSQDILPTY